MDGHTAAASVSCSWLVRRRRSGRVPGLRCPVAMVLAAGCMSGRKRATDAQIISHMIRRATGTATARSTASTLVRKARRGACGTLLRVSNDSAACLGKGGALVEACRLRRPPHEQRKRSPMHGRRTSGVAAAARRCPSLLPASLRSQAHPPPPSCLRQPSAGPCEIDRGKECVRCCAVSSISRTAATLRCY